MAYLSVSTMTEPIKCNILLIGKTGTGKSSFANYLFDTERFTTGSGAPVTKWEENFQQYHFTISNISVNVYDSVGLEPDNFDRWTNELDGFLSERQSNYWGNVNSANNIIHTIFYVVNGAGARIENTELSVLKNVGEKFGLSASVIITNCDIAKKTEVFAIEKEAEKIGLHSFRVCSISKKTRGGDKVEPFGKEPAIRQILSASYEKIGKELTLGLLQEAIDALNVMKRKAKAKIDSSDLSIFNLEAIDSIDLDDILPGFFDLTDYIPPEYKSYQDFLERFDVNYQGRDIMDETIAKLDDVFTSFSEKDIKLVQKGEQLIDDLEHGGFFTKVGAFFKFAGMAVFIKDTVKQGIDEIFDLAINKIRQQLWKVESATFEVKKKDDFHGKSVVSLTKWGIRYKKPQFDLTGILHGHKRLSDGSELGNTSGIKNVVIDYDGRNIFFETQNTVYSCSFDEYTAKYINESEQYWKPGFASPKIFDDFIKQILDKDSRLYGALMDGMINAMVGDLVNQMEADKDVTINLHEVLQQNFENNNNSSLQTLREHMGNGIKLTGAWNSPKNEQEIGDDDLLPGEISAITFEIGGYIVRSAKRVYKVLDDYTEVPAKGDDLLLAKERENNMLGFFGMQDRNTKTKNEISAKLVFDKHGVFADGFKIICQASRAQSFAWTEDIVYICAILTPPSFSLDDELLFVKNLYVGSSYSSETWYKLNPKGTIKSYGQGAYGLEFHEKNWNDAEAPINDEVKQENKSSFCDSCPFKQGYIKFPENPCSRCKKSDYKIYRKMMYDIQGEGEEVLLDGSDLMWYLKNVMGGLKDSTDDLMDIFKNIK